MHTNHETRSQHEPWNAGRIVGAKPPLKPKHIWALRGIRARSVVVQHISGSRFPFEITEPTKDALAGWLAVRPAKGSDWL